MLSFLFWATIYILLGGIPGMWLSRRLYNDDRDVVGAAICGCMCIVLGPVSMAIWILYIAFMTLMPFFVPEYGQALAEERAEAQEALERDRRRLADKLHRQLGLEPIDWKDE